MTDELGNRRNFVARALLLFLIFFPPFYLLIMAWRSAILVPFWDEWELARLLISWWDGAFPIDGILLPHNEHRPFLSWLTFMALAALTDWNMRAEHILNIGFIFALFALISVSLARIHGWKFDRPFLSSLALVSVLVFSPAQNICHWWSFLLVLNSSAVYAVAAFLSISAVPAGLSANLLAACFCWMAAFSAGNGLLAFPICALIMQLGQRRPKIPGIYALFWLANIALFSYFYFPGLIVPAVPGAGAAFLKMAAFFLSYIGSPVACLITFPFKGIWDMRLEFVPFHILAGCFLLAAAAAMLWRDRARFRQGAAELRIPLAFYLLGLGSAIMISYGRSQFGAHGAYASRYILYATFFSLGLILHAGTLHRIGQLQECLWIDARLGGRLFVIFGLAAMITFARGIKLYEHIRQFNQVLTAGLLSNPRVQYADRWLYPNYRTIQGVILGMKRHRIGPYREIEPGFAKIPPLPDPAILAAMTKKPAGTMGRVGLINVEYSGLRHILDVTGWAAPATQRPEPYFVVLDIDGGLFRAIVPVGLPVTGFLKFSLPDPGLPVLSGWGIYWDVDFGPGEHVLKAYSYFPESKQSFELDGENRFNWPG